jgi:integrase
MPSGRLCCTLKNSTRPCWSWLLAPACAKARSWACAGNIHTAPDQSFTRVHLTKTKNDKARSVLLTSPALELLEERRTKLLDSQQAKTATGSFPKCVNEDQPVDLRKPWGSALQAAGIEEFRFHDLRHTTASYLAMNGASLLSISKVLGHQTTKMTERYSHLSKAHISKVLEKMHQSRLGAAPTKQKEADDGTA